MAIFKTCLFLGSVLVGQPSSEYQFWIYTYFSVQQHRTIFGPIPTTDSEGILFMDICLAVRPMCLQHLFYTTWYLCT